MSISYSPQFKLLIANVDPQGTHITALREVRSLQSLNCNLSTGNVVGTLTATWADTDFSTFGDTVSRPKPMVLVQLQLTDPQGQWGIAWTGFADSITRTVNVGASKTYTLQASNPGKLFNITLQTPASTALLAMDYAFGIKGTAVLRYAATQVGYPGALGLLPAATGWAYTTGLNAPGTKGTIDYSADVSGYTWGAISSSVYLSPAQQTYSAILQSLVADTEIELFFNEFGQLIWRPLAYLNITGKELLIQKDRITNHAYTESDQGVLTTVFVRWLNSALQSDQGVWNAPQGMADALKPRAMVFYTPWIISKAGADALAAALGLRYSGNMHTAQLTMIADPHYTVGTTVRVPKFPDLMPIDNPRNRAPNAAQVELTPWYYYYVYAVTYNLQVGGAWTMSLDLRYGRDEKLQFPYIDTPYLQDLIPPLGTTAGFLNQVFDPFNPAPIAAPLQLHVDPKQDPGSLLVDPKLVPPGSLVILKDKYGRPVGAGEYVTAAGPPGSSITLQVNPTGATDAFITIEEPGQLPLPTPPPGAKPPNPPPGAKPPAPAPGGANALNTNVAGDHVSQLWPYSGGKLTGNDDCGPTCVVRYLRNRTRRGQSGLPISGDKHEQIAAIRSAIGHSGNTDFAELTAQLQRYGVATKSAMSWQDVLSWPGEAIILIRDGQPTPAAWPSSFLPPGEGHLILWMKDLPPGNLYNDPLAYDPNTGTQADSQYTASSVQALFQGALLMI